MLRVTATQLKHRLGRYLRAVRAGKEVLVTDRDQPVARLVPHDPRAPGAVIVAQPADPTAPPLGKVDVRGIVYGGPSTTRLLMDEREER